MKSIEHNEQVNVVKWFALQHPNLRLFAIPNAAKRSVKLAGYMKNEGLSAGVPDIFICCAMRGYNGLFVEMKSPKGKVTEPQNDWHIYLRSQDYKVVVCYGFIDAKAQIDDYLKNDSQFC